MDWWLPLSLNGVRLPRGGACGFRLLPDRSGSIGVIIGSTPLPLPTVDLNEHSDSEFIQPRS